MLERLRLPSAVGRAAQTRVRLSRPVDPLELIETACAPEYAACVLESREVVLARAARRLLGASAVILDGSGRVLLVRHTYGRLNWELPGGVGEPGEPVVETAVREVREETGLEVAAERLAGVYFDPETDMHHFVFRCRALDPAARPTPSPPEISACDYFAPAALPRPISDFTIRRIEEALADGPPPLPALLAPRAWLE